MGKLYAQLTDENICHTVSTIKTDIEVPDYSYIGRKYLGDGKWEEALIIPAQHEPTNAEIAENQLILMEGIAALYAEIQEVKNNA